MSRQAQDSPLEQRLRALAQEPVPAPRADFEAGLRASFLQPGSEEAPIPSHRPSGPAWTRGGRPAWIAVAITAAAALLLLWLDASGGRGPAAPYWQTEAGATTTLARALAGAESVPAGASALDAHSAEGLHLRLLPGGRLRRVAGGEDEAGPLQLELLSGELLVWTPGDYAGPACEILTEHATVRMTGTAFSVMTDPNLTCVCVEHGSVSVRRPEGGAARHLVPGEHTWIGLDEGSFEHLGPWGDPNTPLGAGETEHLDPLRQFCSQHAGN